MVAWNRTSKRVAQTRMRSPASGELLGQRRQNRQRRRSDEDAELRAQARDGVEAAADGARVAAGAPTLEQRQERGRAGRGTRAVGGRRRIDLGEVLLDEAHRVRGR